MAMKNIYEYFCNISNNEDVCSFKVESKKVVIAFLYHTIKDVLSDRNFKYKLMKFAYSIEQDDITLTYKKEYEKLKKKITFVFEFYTKINEVKEKTDITRILDLVSTVGNSEDFRFDLEDVLRIITISEINISDSTDKKMFIINKFEEEFVEFIETFLRVLELTVEPCNDEIEEPCDEIEYDYFMFHSKELFFKNIATFLNTLRSTSYEMFNILNTNFQAFSSDQIYNYCKHVITDTTNLRNVIIKRIIY